jgi:hypothetical protein
MGSAQALLAQLVEAADLRSVMSEFESLEEHQFYAYLNRENAISKVGECQPRQYSLGNLG